MITKYTRQVGLCALPACTRDRSMQAEKEKMSIYLKKTYLLIIMVLMMNSKSFSADLYNWSKTEVNMFFTEDTSSKIIGKIKTGDKVEIIGDFKKTKTINENWILKTNESIDTILLIGKMIKVKFKNKIGFCFDTFLISQKYVESEIKNDNIVSAFDYYSKYLKETPIERKQIKDDDSNIEKGKTEFNDGSILSYEYSGYGGGFEVLIEEDKYKELQIMTLKILELKPRMFYQISKSENSITIETDECEFISIEKKENSKTVFGFSNGC